MRFFRVKNWEIYQHYKDRSPPWIKLYNSILEDYEFSCLHDASKLHLILIWALASRNKNKLPMDSGWIKQKIGVTENVDLEALLQLGFIELIPSNDGACGDIPAPMEQTASTMLARSKQHACPEKRREEERRGEEIKKKRDVFLTENFEFFWNAFPKKGFGAKGSKKKALAEFKKLDPDKDLMETMLFALSKQIEQKTQFRKSGEFVENFQHIERWLRNQRWLDDIPELAPQRGRESIQELLTDRSWALPGRLSEPQD